MWGNFVCLSGLRLVDGELLIVATTELPETAIATYGFAAKSNAFSAVLRGVDLALRHGYHG